MKRTLKSLPILLALVVTIVVSACSEIDVNPRGGDEDETPIIVKPKSTNASSADTVTIG